VHKYIITPTEQQHARVQSTPQQRGETGDGLDLGLLPPQWAAIQQHAFIDQK